MFVNLFILFRIITIDKNDTKIQKKNNISLFGFISDTNKIVFNKIIKFVPVISIISKLFLFILEALNKKNEKKLNPKKIVIDKIMFKSSIILI